MSLFKAFSFFVPIAFILITQGTSVSAMNKMPPPEAKLYPGFSRQCLGGGDELCQFSSLDSHGSTLYFKCRENSICFCSRGTAPADELVWPVLWDTATERCSVAKGGPCGADRGIEVDCSEGLNCIQSRCRNATELNAGQYNTFCNDDIDCSPGLYCRQPAQNMEIRIKRCLN